MIFCVNVLRTIAVLQRFQTCKQHWISINIVFSVWCSSTFISNLCRQSSSCKASNSTINSPPRWKLQHINVFSRSKSREVLFYPYGCWGVVSDRMFPLVPNRFSTHIPVTIIAGLVFFRLRIDTAAELSGIVFTDMWRKLSSASCLPIQYPIKRQYCWS